MNLSNSQTKINLMKAFAGECQARSRYEFAAKVARKEGYPNIEKTFKFIAGQESYHSKMFYRFLKEFSGGGVEIDKVTYPVDLFETTLEFLNASYEHEMEEHDIIYKEFGKIAKEEGFGSISKTFNYIAEIEKTHASKFMSIYEKLSSGSLFKQSTKVKWFCTNCGYIYEAEEAPEVCPVCAHPQGYFVLLDKF